MFKGRSVKEPSQSGRIWLLVGIAVAAGGVGAWQWQREAVEVHSAEYEAGKILSQGVCRSCHLYPEPQILDKVTWAMQVLPSMGVRLGAREAHYEDYAGGEHLRAAKVFPERPVLNAEQWRAICTYYLEAAPAVASAPESRTPIRDGLTQFRVIAPPFRKTAGTVLVKVDEAQRRIYAGDWSTNRLEWYGPEGAWQGGLDLESPPVSLLLNPGEALVALIGRFAPSDERLGKVVRLGNPLAEPANPEPVLSQLPRLAQILKVDLNQDSREDLVVCAYGNFLGRFSWYESLADGGWREHVLVERAGAVHAEVCDLNRDGRPDLMLMMAAGLEGIYLLTNEGNGKFLQSTIVEHSPAWGSTYFELADFNGDGHLDILATNGDNADSSVSLPPFKAYHGLRIYLNDGLNQFKEGWFYPLNGAYKAVARDFDQDGKLDLAAISYFPDFRHAPLESFVYFKGLGALKFETSSFADSVIGGRMALDVGDVDGDGFLDLVLGANNCGPGQLPGYLKDRWQKSGPALLILKNLGRK